MIKKLPYGISNYQELIEDDYYYVDKTKYIEMLENLAEKRIMFLRPRKFGKTLFTSAIENYYDIKKKDKFERLFKETYIGKHPTLLKNSYHILRFNFSGIDTTDEETTMRGFKEKVMISIDGFAKNYRIDFYTNPELTPEGMLRSIIEAFKFQKQNQKIYVIIDEYDHFANELLGFNTNQFKSLVSKNEKERIYNSNMCLYFLSNAIRLKRMPDSLVDVNIASDYSKIGKMLDLCKGEKRAEIIEKTVSGDGILSEITQKFNPAMEFTDTDLVSMLYYLGYLTILGEKLGKPELKVPNKVMREIYSEYFMKLIEDKANMQIDNDELYVEKV